MISFTLVARGVLLGTTMALAGLGGLSAAALAAPPDPAQEHQPSRFHRMSQARLGIVPLAISPELRKHLGATEDRGVLVDQVVADSPAAKADIRVGDVIVSVDGDDVASRDDIVRALSDRQAKDLVTVLLVRDEVTMPVMVAVDKAMMQASRDDMQRWEDNFPSPFEWMKRGAQELRSIEIDSEVIDDLNDTIEDLRDEISNLRERLERLEQNR